MSKTILEQALDHLLNKEEDKASALLHDYYVGIGRKVYEDIMTDDMALEDEDHLSDLDNSIDEVDADLTEEGEDMDMEAGEEAGEELEAELGAEEAVSADAADVADAMLDVESALAKLKAEFEEMISGTGDHDSEMSAPEGEEETEEEVQDEMGESLEESLELSKVSAPDNSDKADSTSSPVAKRNPMMARPATKFGGSASGDGVASGTTPAKAPSSKDMASTTRPAMSKVAKPGVAPGREAGSSQSDLPRG